MKQKQKGFTLLEIWIGIFLASALAGVLITTLIAFKTCYQRVMVLATLQDDGRFAMSVLRRHIHAAESVIDVISEPSLSAHLKRVLQSKSDVLVIKENGQDMAFYLAATSWIQGRETVFSLFEKPQNGHRQELVLYMVALHFKQEWGGIYYDFTLRSAEPIGHFIQRGTDAYVYRTWYGFAALGVDDGVSS